VRVGAFVTHDADRADIGQNRERLPDITFEPGGLDLFADDRIGVLQDRRLAGSDLADDAYAESWPREGLAPHDLVGQTQLGTHLANLVLEQAAQWLDQLELHVVGQTTDIVVGLDLGGVLGTRLDDIGIQRALHQEFGVSDATRRFFEDADEQFTDGLALLLGIDDTGETFEESISGTHVDQLDALMAAERLDDLLGL